MRLCARARNFWCLSQANSALANHYSVSLYRPSVFLPLLLRTLLYFSEHGACKGGGADCCILSYA